MNWRTLDVLAICAGMRESQDYSSCPILADALQDAYYPNEEELAQLRKPIERWEAERLVAIIYSKESAAAVTHIEAFADRVGYTYKKVIEGVRHYVATGELYAGEADLDYEDPDYSAAWLAEGAFYSEAPKYSLDQVLLNEFYTAYELVTGTRVELLHRKDSPFTCPC